MFCLGHPVQCSGSETYKRLFNVFFVFCYFKQQERRDLTNGQTDIYVPRAPVGAKNIYHNLSIIFFVKSGQITKASSFLHHVHKSCSKHD